jgi:dihydroorotate dehydrogenase
MTWRDAAYRVARPLLFAVDPESIHGASLWALAIAGWHASALCRLASGVRETDASRAPAKVMGLRFRNRIGLGAGFDKDGVAIAGWAALGFGFVELGTVTPRPQAGNPRPRLFRLTHDEALINRMGFNNAGADALARRITSARPLMPDGFVIGVNIGRNVDGSVDDYPAAAAAVASVADYLAINVSSPNTPGLRQLQEPDALRQIVDAVAEAAPGIPLVVKLSPDLSDDERAAILDRLTGGPVAGLVVSNTTVTRPNLRSRRLAQEEGGLSGRPLLRRTLAAVHVVAGRGVPVIASGGIGSGDDVRAARAVGADLVQLWTGMIYAGPGLIGAAVTSSRMAEDTVLTVTG